MRFVVTLPYDDTSDGPYLFSALVSVEPIEEEHELRTYDRAVKAALAEYAQGQSSTNRDEQDYEDFAEEFIIERAAVVPVD